jgi:hypothetical protein
VVAIRSPIRITARRTAAPASKARGLAKGDRQEGSTEGDGKGISDPFEREGFASVGWRGRSWFRPF